MSSPSTPQSGLANEKTPDIEHTERIATHDRVPGHENYYEKNGLRTYGDGEDHGMEARFFALRPSVLNHSVSPVLILLPMFPIDLSQIRLPLKYQL